MENSLIELKTRVLTRRSALAAELAKVDESIQAIERVESLVAELDGACAPPADRRRNGGGIVDADEYFGKKLAAISTEPAADKVAEPVKSAHCWILERVEEIDKPFTADTILKLNDLLEVPYAPGRIRDALDLLADDGRIQRLPCAEGSRAAVYARAGYVDASPVTVVLQPPPAPAKPEPANKGPALRQTKTPSPAYETRPRKRGNLQPINPNALVSRVEA